MICLMCGYKQRTAAQHFTPRLQRQGQRRSLGLVNDLLGQQSAPTFLHATWDLRTSILQLTELQVEQHRTQGDNVLACCVREQHHVLSCDTELAVVRSNRDRPLSRGFTSRPRPQPNPATYVTQTHSSAKKFAKFKKVKRLHLFLMAAGAHVPTLKTSATTALHSTIRRHRDGCNLQVFWQKDSHTQSQELTPDCISDLGDYFACTARFLVHLVHHRVLSSRPFDVPMTILAHFRREKKQACLVLLRHNRPAMDNAPRMICSWNSCPCGICVHSNSTVSVSKKTGLD